jgi:hypothetical protein
MKTLNKKQEQVYRNLDIYTREQRSNYYQEVVYWNQAQLKKIANSTAGENGRYGVQQRHIDSAKDKLEGRLGILMLEWLKDAEVFFNAKLLVMTNKLDGFGFIDDNVSLNYSTMEVSDGGDFEFWISATSRKTYESLGRVHARLIPVDGAEKCFHYRFITTLKK